MKFLGKKLEKILSFSGKAIVFLTLATVVFSPFVQLGGTPIARAQSSEQNNCLPGAGNNCDQPPQDSLTCSLTNPSVCLASIVYVFTVGLGSTLAYVGGFMFDTTVSLSLNSSAYALDFLSSGWTTARDLANMAFILILVYIAFMIMFQAETAGTIRTLAWVIFIALIINFSFFFTRVVIDAGNILAVQFYNSIDPGGPTLQETISKTSADTGATANIGAGIAGMLPVSAGTYANTKDLTAGIMQALNIQQLFNNKSFQSFAAQSGWGSKLIMLTFLYIAIGACYFILAAMFFAVAIKFLMRIVVLWFLIIASPLAFICKAVPHNPQISGWYDRWQHELVNHAFYPAFFLFIFFFIHAVLKGLTETGGILGGLATDLNSIASVAGQGPMYIVSMVASVAIRLGFIIAMLYIALKSSEYMGVKGAGVAHSISSKITGAGISGLRWGAGLPMRGVAATGGIAGRNTAGALGGSISRSLTLRKMESGPLGFAAKGIRNAGGYVGDRTFDIRNAPGGKSALSLGGALTVGAGAKNGYRKGVEESAKAKEKQARDLEPTPIEKQDAEAKAKAETDKEFAPSMTEAEKKRDEQKNLVAISTKRTGRLQEGTDEWKNSKRAQEVDEKNLAAAEKEVGAIKERVKEQISKRSKEYSGEGLSTKYANEALLNRISLSARNPLFITRSSKEAAFKILKGKSKDQEAPDAKEKSNSNGDGGGDDKGPKGGGPGGTGGGSGKGGSGGSSGGGSAAAGRGGGSAGGPSASAGGPATASLDKESLRELKGIRNDLKEHMSSIASRLESHPVFTQDNRPSAISLSNKQVQSLGSAITKAANDNRAPLEPKAANDNRAPMPPNDNQATGERKAA